ncbi:hypothetical protein ACHAXA_010559 [Cyclostephanos tholiformis]|uniref:Sm domain-containing protein n=1 Tax=Cyclostephanos tholiformis TaxID=382380 RepID=A0ABD3RTU6_9STRA
MSTSARIAEASNNTGASPLTSTSTSTTAATTTTAAKNRAKSHSESNLAPLLRHFVGIDVVVETKQGRTFRGKLIEADVHMNLVIDSRRRIRKLRKGGVAECRTIGGGSSYNDDDDDDDDDVGCGGEGGEFDWVHIRGPTIRYIAFGANVDISGVIRAGRDRERAAGDRYRRGVRKAPKH